MLPHFRAFENLWKNHRMNKTERGDNGDANCDNDTLDVYTLNEDHLWTTSELEEMKKPKRKQAEKSTVVLDKTNNGEGDIGVDRSKRVSRSKGRGSSLETESRPDFYHGVGPCNDVNLPGVWFFRIPHKVCNNHENYRKCYILLLRSCSLADNVSDKFTCIAKFVSAEVLILRDTNLLLFSMFRFR